MYGTKNTFVVLFQIEKREYDYKFKHFKKQNF